METSESRNQSWFGDIDLAIGASWLTKYSRYFSFASTTLKMVGEIQFGGGIQDLRSPIGGGHLNELSVRR